MDGAMSENSARGSIKAAEVHQDNGMRGRKGNEQQNKHQKLKRPSED